MTAREPEIFVSHVEDVATPKPAVIYVEQGPVPKNESTDGEEAGLDFGFVSDVLSNIWSVLPSLNVTLYDNDEESKNYTESSSTPLNKDTKKSTTTNYVPKFNQLPSNPFDVLVWLLIAFVAVCILTLLSFALYKFRGELY